MKNLLKKMFILIYCILVASMLFVFRKYSPLGKRITEQIKKHEQNIQRRIDRLKRTKDY